MGAGAFLICRTCRRWQKLFLALIITYDKQTFLAFEYDDVMLASSRFSLICLKQHVTQ